jgi:inorganic phosphate transporter, PiT family
VISVFLSSIFYMGFRCLRLHFGITKEMCFCIGNKEQTVTVPQPAGSLSFSCFTRPDISMDTPDNCTVKYKGRVLGISAQKTLNGLHYISAGMVSFARGLNDTPKIVALLLILNAFDIRFGMLVIGIAMAMGGLVNARKVAQKMSKEITPMNHGPGFTANLVTSFLVIVASRLGMPVSTTHVPVGSLFGLTLVTRKGNAGVISKIFLSWVLTLPMAAVIGAGIFWTLKIF